MTVTTLLWVLILFSAEQHLYMVWNNKPSLTSIAIVGIIIIKESEQKQSESYYNNSDEPSGYQSSAVTSISISADINTIATPLKKMYKNKYFVSISELRQSR